jgi:8-oxo-dGTP diphosphatase
MGVHMGGLWEFPGGKVEDGEPPEAALARELMEELALTVAVRRPVTFAIHEEPGLRILLLFYEAVVVDGAPTPLEGQEIAWVAPSELAAYPMPPADAALVELLSRRVAP